MADKTTDVQIALSDDAMLDHDVEEHLTAFSGHASTLARACDDPVAYQEAAEELCRVSRRAIWSLVTNVVSNATQVELAATQFETAAELIDPQLASEPDVVTAFRRALMNRATQLRGAWQDFHDHGASGIVSEDQWARPAQG